MDHDQLFYNLNKKSGNVILNVGEKKVGA